MTKLYYLVCVVLIFGCCDEGARILGLFHVPTKSHFNIGFPILKGLADKGHDVTIASIFPSKEGDVNYRDVYIDGVHQIGDDVEKFMFEISNSSFIKVMDVLANFTKSLVNTTLHSPEIQNLIKRKEKFDVIILDAFGNEAFFGLQHIFNAHLIVISTGNNILVNHLTGNVAPYSFVPSNLAPFSDKMTFVQRISNILYHLMIGFYLKFYVINGQKAIYEEFFKNVPAFEDTVKNVSLVFVNSHVLFETPRPYLPNMIPIGGVQIKEPKKLPQGLQKLLDESKNGVILFSLGSNLNSKNLPENTVQTILKTFAKLPQQVLWKFEDENLEKQLPKNVYISKWYPQSDLLAHPNLKLFITHGGLLSSTEAVYRGVPIIGIPIYGDQFANSAKLVAAGYGQQLLLEDLTEESFTSVLKEVLENKGYRQKVQESSVIFQHEINHPVDRAVFWVEHVVKTKGARHLRSASIDLSLSEYLLLDILIFAGIVAGTFITGICLLIKILCCATKDGRNINKNKKLS